MGMAEDVSALEREFPAWDFEPYWQAAGNGPDARWLRGRHGLVTLTAADAAGLARAIREAGG